MMTQSQIEYRKPIWENGTTLRLKNAKMTLWFVEAGNEKTYGVSRSLSAECGVPPELIRHALDGKSSLVLSAEPGPFVARLEDVQGLLRNELPEQAYADFWSLYQPLDFSDQHEKGWLIRLADCDAVKVPRIEVTGQPGLIETAERENIDYDTEGNRDFMDEGDFLLAKSFDYLAFKEPGRPFFWNSSEMAAFSKKIPYVQEVISAFRSNGELPDSWLAFNLAYAVRWAWFLQQEVGSTWPTDADLVSTAFAFECALFDENNHL